MLGLSLAEPRIASHNSLSRNHPAGPARAKCPRALGLPPPGILSWARDKDHERPSIGALPGRGEPEWKTATR